MLSTGTIDDSQRLAAKVAGVAYLLTNVTAVFAVFYVPSRLFVEGDIAKTAANLAASGWLYRLGIASDLVTVVGLIFLIVALYVILRPVNRNLALLALSLRLIEQATLVVATLDRLSVLDLTGSGKPLSILEPVRLQEMTTLFDARGNAYLISLAFAGLGSAVYAYVFFQSNYVPKLLAVWGVFSSLLMTTCVFIFVVFPQLEDRLAPGCWVPLLIFELATGAWLLIRGLPLPSSAPQHPTVRAT